MPLINDELRHTDRKRIVAWPWVLVVGVFCAICIVVAVVVSRITHGSAATRVDASLVGAPIVQTEQQLADSGNWQAVLQYVMGYPPDASYSFNDKHTHYVLGERAFVKMKKPKFAAAFQSRFRTWAAQIKSPQCQACHSQGMHPQGGPGVTATGPRS